MSAKRKRNDCSKMAPEEKEEKCTRKLVEETLVEHLAGDVLHEIDDYLADWTEIVFVLDKSGSMQTVVADTISSVNDYITDQQQTEEKVLFSLLQFNDRVVTTVAKASIHDVPPLTRTDYIPSRGTALHDAIGCAIIKGRSSEATNKILVVFTDGAENESKMYTKQAIQKLVTEIRAENWQVIYMRANADEFLVGNEARDLGINFAVPVTNTIGDRGVSMPNIPVLMRQVSEYTRLTQTNPMAAATLQRTLSCQVPPRRHKATLQPMPLMMPMMPMMPPLPLRRQNAGIGATGPFGTLGALDESDDEMPATNPTFSHLTMPTLTRAKS